MTAPVAVEAPGIGAAGHAPAASAVPDDLARWFNGEDVLVKSNGLRRIEVRHRVVEVLRAVGEGDDQVVFPGEVREFKSSARAEACAEEWARQGRVVLVQHAPVLWLTGAEVPVAGGGQED